MNTISKPYIEVVGVTLKTSLLYRCFFEAGGVGVPGLTLQLKITNPAGNNVSIALNTTWAYVERTNIQGDYEVNISLIPEAAIFTSFGQYTLEIDSQDPGVGKLVTHFTLDRVYGRVVSAPTTTGFVTDLPSTVLDFYKDGYLLMLTGGNAGCGPKKVTAYTTGKAITINALPVTPAADNAFCIIRF